MKTAIPRTGGVGAFLLAVAVYSAAAQAGASSALDAHPLALRGLDPVSLVDGQEVAGLPTVRSEYGRFTYYFSSTAHREQFLADPVIYSVQGDGKCLHMRQMDGDPNFFKVVDRRIYLAANAGCLQSLVGNLDSYVRAFTEARKRVAILIFPGVQIIDYTGPWEVFGEAGYEVFSVAATPDAVVTNMGMRVTPNYTFASAPKADIVVLPGGAVPNTVTPTDPVLLWIQQQVRQSEIAISVCNGAFWLANAGLLDGKRATTTSNGNSDALARSFPKITVVTDERFVDAGRIITTAGLSSGIDGALHVVERLDGRAQAQVVALGMEYDWRPDAGFARGALADKYIRRLGEFDLPPDVRVRVREQSGARDRWQKSWAVTAPQLPSGRLAQIFEKTCSKAWVKLSETSDATGSRANWSFRGDDGRLWTALTVVRPAGGADGDFVVTFSVEQKQRS